MKKVVKDVTLVTKQGVLRLLKDQADRAWMSTKSDRRRLADYEDQHCTNVGSMSILGEIELFVDQIHGAYDKVIRENPPEDTHEKIESLSQLSLFRYHKLGEWIESKGRDYPSLLSFLLLEENLRHYIVDEF